jgi:hypothetical protein
MAARVNRGVSADQRKTRIPLVALWIVFGILFALGFYYAFGWALEDESSEYVRGMEIKHAPPPPVLDKADYDRRMYILANYPDIATSTYATTSPKVASSTRAWPVRSAPYPKVGAILPFYRVIAYYGNFLSRGMGVLGEYDPPEMLEKLRAEVKKWEAADPMTPVKPALHYILVTAQASAGRDGMYRARMSDSQIDKALELAKEVDGIIFLDFQVGFSTVQQELPQYEEYLKLPNVHVGVDPEFSMKGKHPPGKEIGTFDATDINWVANYLAGLVKANDLPPKILMVHRFTHDMVTNVDQITPLPEVQIVMDMDGWGDKAKKAGTYNNVVAAEPVQFMGFKLFYKNDLFAPSTGLYTPEELMKLTPRPIYIQYQ